MYYKYNKYGEGKKDTYTKIAPTSEGARLCCSKGILLPTTTSRFGTGTKILRNNDKIIYGQIA